MENFLLINKPEGWTSFDVVGFVRKKLMNEQANSPLPRASSSKPLATYDPSGELTKRIEKQKRIKVGHAGTLDPFATGLLIVGVGREATKKLDEFKMMPKTYVATIKLGEVSDTFDRTGHITICHPEFIYKSSERRVNLFTLPSERRKYVLNYISGSVDKMLKQVQHDNKQIPELKQIKEVIKSFTGKQKQIPPMFSAKKINGQRLYDLARKGITVERQPNEIEIYDIKILDYPDFGATEIADPRFCPDSALVRNRGSSIFREGKSGQNRDTWPFLKIEVQCSAGTYIRSLADDIGRKLETGAYCDQLVRTKIGEYTLDKALNINNLI